MNYRLINQAGIELKWGAIQDSEHSDLCIKTDRGEVWVQVETRFSDRRHNELYTSGQKEFPISDGTAGKIITQVIKRGYLEKYFETDIGLIYTEFGDLIEN
jgi:hypothetical protein